MRAIIILVVFFLVVYFSVNLRCRNKRSVSEAAQFDPKESPFSKGLVELVTVAGGIYISLTLAVSFLKIEYPPMYKFSELEFDVLAAVALVFALIQPIVIYIYNKLNMK